MRPLIFILSFLYLSGLLNQCFGQSLDIQPFQKKIKRLIAKNFDTNGQTYTMELMGNEKLGPVRNDYYRISQNEIVLGFFILSKGRGCHVGGCDITSQNQNFETKYESFIFITLMSNLSVIKEVRVLDYESDYGYEICSRLWLKQFKNHKGCELYYGQNIDAISGATVSGNSITNAIQNICTSMNMFNF